MSGEFEVRDNGAVLMPAVGSLQARGLTPAHLAAALAQRLRGVLADPRVSVAIASRRPLAVNVLGEVRAPGRYELRDGDGVLDALARAGGITPFASPNDIYLVRRHERQMRVRFRYADLTRGSPESIGFEIADGDAIVVE
jgi:polysaccharide export outer membrane protein